MCVFFYVCQEVCEPSLLVVMQLGVLVALWLFKCPYTQYRLMAGFNRKASVFVLLAGSERRPM